jgi:signal transduction histidine kinase
MRAFLIRVGQIAVTFALFSIFNALAFHFEIEPGVSILFPATAISIVACMVFGWWAAIGVILGTIATPWGENVGLRMLIVSGVISAIEGMIPWLVFRARRDLSTDLRDMRSLLAFLFFGTVVNTGFSAIAGNLLIVSHPAGVQFVWHEVFVWWIADFTAALLLATPALAFGNALLSRIRTTDQPERRPRTITNALQILAVIVMLGFATSIVIRMTLLNRVEADVKHARVMTAVTLVDSFVFIILALASATLVLNISRPFAQVREAIEALREDRPVDPASIQSGYLEFRSLADALAETQAELRSRERELRLQTERAIEASKHKSDFLAKMSHELRTPLNSIIGFSDLLAEQEATIDSEKRIAFLENVSTSARHLLGLINDLLDVSKIESGKMKMHFEPVDLRTSIANSVKSTSPLFVRKRQQVIVSVPDEPMMALADPSRVEQVLLNLLSNANKYSPEGKKISVLSAMNGSGWRISVKDSGIGISNDDQVRIFDDFEQVYTRGPNSSGTGLGLALVKRFVEMHGGQVEVESAPGEGSTFTVTFPRQTADSRQQIADSR